MSIGWFLVFIVVAALLGYFFHGGREDCTNNVMLRAAGNSATKTAAELEAVLDKLERLRELSLENPGVSSIRAVAMLQLAYVHDLMGVMIAYAASLGQPPLAFLVAVAHGRAWDWVPYINTMSDQLAKMAETNNAAVAAEVESLRKALNETRQPMKELRSKLQQALREEGVDHHGLG